MPYFYKPDPSAFSSSLGRRRLPHARSGQILYRCSHCQCLWLSDGPSISLSIEPTEIAQLVSLFAPDLKQLPRADCLRCRVQAGQSRFSFDEYVEGRAGYSIIWQTTEPVRIHLFASVISEKMLFTAPLPPAPHEVKQRKLAHALLSWLTSEQRWPCLRTLEGEEHQVMALDLVPGQGMSGTEGWLWKGAVFQQQCPPLRGTVLTTLAIALPPDEPFAVRSLVRFWQDLASLALESAVFDKRKG